MTFWWNATSGDTNYRGGGLDIEQRGGVEFRQPGRGPAPVMRPTSRAWAWTREHPT
jgi:hypothetical protein